VAQATRGTVNLGGHFLDPPYTLLYRDGQPIVNGFAFAPEPPPHVAPINSEAAALSAASSLGPSVIAEGRLKQWSDERILAEWQARAHAIPSIKSVTVAKGEITFRSTSGVTIVERLASNRPHAAVDIDSLDAENIRLIEEALNADALVFVLPDAILTFPGTATEAFRSAAEKIHRSAPLTPQESRTVDSTCQRFLRHPVKLIRVP
jgi:hypothetical protein